MFTVHVIDCEESEGSFLERVWEDASERNPRRDPAGDKTWTRVLHLAEPEQKLLKMKMSFRLRAFTASNTLRAEETILEAQ